MSNGVINQINSPHFYNDVAYDNAPTFEDLMDCAVGGSNKPKMHLWLSASATQEQIELVRRMICGKT